MMEKGSRKTDRIDLPAEPKARPGQPSTEQKGKKGQKPVEPPKLTVDELEPRVAPRSIGTFF